jgi:hypothetical protein
MEVVAAVEERGHDEAACQRIAAERGAGVGASVASAATSSASCGPGIISSRHLIQSAAGAVVSRPSKPRSSAASPRETIHHPVIGSGAMMARPRATCMNIPFSRGDRLT